HRAPLRVGHVLRARLPHCAVVHLRVDAHRLRRLEAPEDEVEVMGRFHRRWRELDAAADLLAETACDVAADQGGARLADGAAADAAAPVGVLRIEALRIADRELEIFVLRNSD